MSKSRYMVDAEHSGGHFPLDYFPRRFHYKADAERCAEEALRHGATNISINGIQLCVNKLEAPIEAVFYRMAVYGREGIPESTVATRIVNLDGSKDVAYVEQALKMKFIRWAT